MTPLSAMAPPLAVRMPEPATEPVASSVICAAVKFAPWRLIAPATSTALGSVKFAAVSELEP